MKKLFFCVLVFVFGQIVFAQSEENYIGYGATFPIPFTKENYDTFYPGINIRYISNDIFGFTGGLSWQLTDKANYFFLDMGVEGCYNFSLGEKFVIAPNVSIIGKLNLVTSDPAAGVSTEGALNLFFIDQATGSGKFGIKISYLYSFIFPFKKESDFFHFGTLGIGFCTKSLL